MSRRIAIVSLSLVIAACPGNNGSGPSDTGGATDVDEHSDAGTDAKLTDSGPDRDVEPDAGQRLIIGSRVPAPAQDGVSPDGAADVESEISGEARAGRITGETGFAGLWSHCKTGDLRLYNGVVEACISNEQSNRYEMFAGGGLVDVRTVGTTADEVFDLYAPRIGFNTLHVETVEVIRDGSDGGPAVIRAEGTDMPAAYFVGVAGEQAFQPKGLSVSVEYRLAPDGDFFEIATFIRNDQDDPVQTQRGGPARIRRSCGRFSTRERPRPRWFE